MELTILSSDNDVVRMRLSGEVVQATLPGLSERIETLLGSEDYRRRVLLDLAQTPFIDSSGLGWLLALNKRFRESAGMLVLHSVLPMVLDVIRVMRLDRVLHVVEDQQAALSMVQAPPGDKP